jgi:dTDP-4-dehydrorhamnose reductase
MLTESCDSGGNKVTRILVTGGEGQLGSDIALELTKDFDVASVDIQDFDITNLNATVQFMNRIKPEVVVHCAAFADVDACETEPDRAYLVNGVGARNVAIAARKLGAQLVHISTDYVFDGEQIGPYREYDYPNPKTVYGMSKLMGERFVAQQTHAHFILRIAWLYGRTGHNFVRTVLRLAQTKDELRVVNDQHGTPTCTVDVARQVQRLLQSEAYGIYHATSQGSCSWFELAVAVLEKAGINVPVVPVTSAEYPRPAPRPRNSVLDNHLLRIQGMDIMPTWQESLARFMADTSFVAGEESR